ncbi:MAG TPA: peptidase, partial [Eggerthellaceae bacterium]|nr:peptidase [Eggerthellaceae bacterium]
RNQNHFNPRKNLIVLDPHVYGSSTVTAIATACHEVGHACQFAQGYFPMKIRSALVPVVQFTQGSWFIILLIGVLLNVAGLVDLALIFYAVSVVFHAITLPVEFNASRRALDYLTEIGVAEEEKSGAGAVLRACALTYVATALISAIYLLYRAVRHRRIR